MKIGIIGLGYVGLSTALGLGKLKNEVYGYEINVEKRITIQNKIMPIFEEGMQQILEEILNINFFLVKDLEELLQKVDAVFICVPTPSREDGSIDLTFITNLFRKIGKILIKIEEKPVLIVKSTVVPGTTRKLKELIISENKLQNEELEVAMVPEFLKQGSAYKDFISPDRIVIGVENQASKAEKILLEMFKEVKCQKSVVDLETAEFSKYASNSFLAMKISFANELANIVDAFNLEKEGREVNIDKIVEIMGMDKRINPYYLGAGPGYGGSCFPKDVKALASFSRSLNTPFTILETISDVNKKQAKIVIKHARRLLGTLENKKIGIFGLAFKANTDDTRDSPAKEIIKELLQERAKIFAWDPKAEQNIKKEFPKIIYHDNIADFERDKLDAGIIVTEWKEIKEYFKKSENKYPIIDTRRIGIETKYVVGNSRL